MRTKTKFNAFVVFAAVLIITLVTGSAFSQGRGKGHGGNRGGDRGGGRGHQQRMERPQFQRQGRQQRAERPQFQRQDRQQRAERPQFRRQDRQQRPNVVWQGRERQNPGIGNVERRRSQANYDRGSRREMQQRHVLDQRRNGGYAGREIYSIPWLGDRGRNVRNRPERYRANNAWPNNYGYERSREVHIRNAERKALREEYKYRDRDFDDRDGSFYTYAGVPYYPYARYAERHHLHWSDLLRNIVVNVSSYNAGRGRHRTFWSVTYDPFYAPDPSYYYYNGHPRYRSYAYRPYVVDDIRYGYIPEYYSPLYYPADSDGFHFSAGLAVSFDSGYDRQLSDQLVAMGYEQGYNDGLYARNAGYGDRYYDDPYTYEDAIYDPYSYSVGVNRHCLSDGYQLGYLDAQNRRLGGERYRDNDVGLVSVLISSSLTVF